MFPFYATQQLQSKASFQDKKNLLPLSHTGLSTLASDHQYTSNISPLAIPCSISTHFPWEKITAMGVHEGRWDFFRRTDSGPVSVDPQRIFTLSLGESAGWQAGDEDTGLIPTPDFKKGDLSLARSRGKGEDAGDYVCRLEFKNGQSLTRTVHVHVLQSELKQVATSAAFVSLLDCVALMYSLCCPASLLAARPTNWHSQEVVVALFFFPLRVAFSAPMHCAYCFLHSAAECIWTGLGPAPVLTCV